MAEQEQHEDRLLQALADLPRPELTDARRAEITAALRGALASAGDTPSISNRWYSWVERWVEPSLMAACSCLVLIRLALFLARFFSA